MGADEAVATDSLALVLEVVRLGERNVGCTFCCCGEWCCQSILLLLSRKGILKISLAPLSLCWCDVSDPTDGDLSGRPMVEALVVVIFDVLLFFTLVLLCACTTGPERRL